MPTKHINKETIMKHDNENETVQVFQIKTDARLEKLQAGLQQQVNAETVPSGILLRTNAWNSKLDKRNGTQHSPVMTQMEWLDMFSVLTGSAILEKDADSVDVMTEAEPFWADGVVPIYIADFAYERLRPRWFTHIKRTLELPAEESVSIPTLSKVVNQHHTFFASVLLHPDYDLFAQIAGKHHGKKVKFVIPASGYKTNTGRLIESIDFNFDDGTSVKIRPDETIEHEFADYGTKKITLLVHTEDGDTRITKFSFEVAEQAPEPNATWYFKDTNGNNAATAWVFYGRSRPGGPIRTKLEKPVLLSDGFPGGRKLDKLWPLVNQSSFAVELLGQGRDFIILGYDDGKRKIQENAVFYEACIKKIIAEKQNNQKIAAGGASMGGLIARYALCKMETDNFDHHANLYFTVDTPHEGANIPVSAQAFVQFYARENCGKLKPAVTHSARLMQSDAAQQMLLQWVRPYEQWGSNKPYPLASAERKEFLDDLRAVGWMPKVFRIGVADGTGNGVSNGVTSNHHVLSWPFSYFNWAHMWSSAEGVRRWIVEMKGVIGLTEIEWRITHGGQRIDGAPGGTSDTWGQIYVGVSEATCDFLYHCFIPTTSACAINSNNLYININTMQYRSDLHAFKVSSTKNLEHVVLTPELKTFLVEKIINHPAAPDLDSWARNMPVEGSRGWVNGYGVRYAVAYEFKDGSEYRGAWWAPTTGGRAPDKDGYNGDNSYALANLKNISCDPTNKAVARHIYRQFRNQPERMVGRILGNTATTWTDEDLDRP
jgi:hypothetical protein